MPATRKRAVCVWLASALAPLIIGQTAAIGQGDGKLLAPPPPRTAAPAAKSAPSVPASRDLTPAYTADSRAGLKVNKGTGTLPNDHGQVWREYDIAPYTLRVRNVAKPEQAIITDGNAPWTGGHGYEKQSH